MDPIYDIGIDDITVYIPEPNSIHPPVLPNIHPPVTVDLGFPVVDIPGCVKAHQDNNREGKPWDKDLVNDDPDQTMVLCPHCLLYTSPSPRDRTRSRMPSSA